MPERKGHYERKGDIEEWVWDEDDTAPAMFAGYGVPEPEFDPRSAPDPAVVAAELAPAPEPEPKPKASPKTTKTTGKKA